MRLWNNCMQCESSYILMYFNFINDYKFVSFTMAEWRLVRPSTNKVHKDTFHFLYVFFLMVIRWIWRSKHLLDFPFRSVKRLDFETFFINIRSEFWCEIGCNNICMANWFFFFQFTESSVSNFQNYRHEDPTKSVQKVPCPPSLNWYQVVMMQTTQTHKHGNVFHWNTDASCHSSVG